MMQPIKTMYTVDELHRLLCESFGWRYRMRVWLARVKVRWHIWTGQF